MLVLPIETCDIEQLYVLICLFIMLLFVILYLFMTFWGISVAAAAVVFSIKLVISEF